MCSKITRHSLNAWLYYLVIYHNIKLQYIFQTDAIFLTIHISQGSVATCFLRCGGIFKHEFIANLLTSLAVKKFENRLIFGEVMGNSLVSCFFDSQCRSGVHYGKHSAIWQIWVTNLSLASADMPSITTGTTVCSRYARDDNDCRLFLVFFWHAASFSEVRLRCTCQITNSKSVQFRW